MHLHKTLKEHLVLKGDGNGVQGWKWWKTNLLDVDTEVGVVLIKTRAAPDTPVTTHDVSRKVAGNKLVLRTHVTERVKNILTVSKGAQYAQPLNKLLVDTVNEATEMADFDADASA